MLQWRRSPRSHPKNPRFCVPIMHLMPDRRAAHDKNANDRDQDFQTTHRRSTLIDPALRRARILLWADGHGRRKERVLKGVLQRNPNCAREALETCSGAR